MKLTQEKTEVAKSAKFETMQYGVDASNLPLLFQLLRTNLYSDLHGSIIRELVSNVIDSHTEAGKPEAMGEVEWIPSSKILGVDCQLVVRDYGVGLSPERMRDVYGNYLSSTKREDNKAIGGFGLGSKVPFAYTDSFSVQTIYDGVKYRYLCYIDETQLGAISLLTMDTTSEGNQTEIIIPIKDEHRDFQLFQAAISKQLGYFTTIKYKGFQAPSPLIEYEDEVCIIKDNPPISNLHIILGNVAYEIDYTALGMDQWKMGSEGVVNCDIGLKFGIGELQPTMSRESLYWNQATKDKVIAKIALAKKAIRKQLEKELDAEKDWAKWYGFASAHSTVSFSAQWNFAAGSNELRMTTPQGKLSVRTKLMEWFAGHNVRYVGPSYSAKVDYSTGLPTFQQLQNCKAYKLERNLSAATCLFLFRTHPQGFLAVSKLSVPDPTDPTTKDLVPYYEATKAWREGLDSYDDLEVPDDMPQSALDERAKQYRELVKQRKLEGKFTAKRMRKDVNRHHNIEENYIYNIYESKFEDISNHTIIYGFQTDHTKMCKVMDALSLSMDFHNRFYVDPYTGRVNSKKPITVLKIGQNYEKQFHALKHSYSVDEVLELNTPFKETLASIATALRIKPFLHAYHSLKYFDYINLEMKNRYVSLLNFVTEYTHNEYEINKDTIKFIRDLCKDNLNKEMEDEWVKIQEYLKGVELLKSVNFEKEDNDTHEGSITHYIKTWVRQSVDSIRDYLRSNGKVVDGDQQVPEPEKAVWTKLHGVDSPVFVEEELLTN